MCIQLMMLFSPCFLSTSTSSSFLSTLSSFLSSSASFLSGSVAEARGSGATGSLVAARFSLQDCWLRCEWSNDGRGIVLVDSRNVKKTLRDDTYPHDSVRNSNSKAIVVAVGAIINVVFTPRRQQTQATAYIEEIFSYRDAAFSYRTVVEHAVVVRIFTLVSSSAPIV